MKNKVNIFKNRISFLYHWDHPLVRMRCDATLYFFILVSLPLCLCHWEPWSTGDCTLVYSLQCSRGSQFSLENPLPGLAPLTYGGQGSEARQGITNKYKELYRYCWAVEAVRCLTASTAQQ